MAQNQGVDTNGDDQHAMQVFLKSLEMLGGMRTLVENGQLEWLPQLVESSYALVMVNEQRKSVDEIADFLGVTKGDVTGMIEAPTQAATVRMKTAPLDEPHLDYAAAGVAKSAYQVLRKELGERL